MRAEARCGAVARPNTMRFFCNSTEFKLERVLHLRTLGVWDGGREMRKTVDYLTWTIHISSLRKNVNVAMFCLRCPTLVERPAADLPARTPAAYICCFMKANDSVITRRRACQEGPCAHLVPLEAMNCVNECVSPHCYRKTFAEPVRTGCRKSERAKEREMYMRN